MIDTALKGWSKFSHSVKEEVSSIPGLNDLKKQFAQRLMKVVDEIVQEELKNIPSNLSGEYSEKELKRICNSFANDEVFKSVLGNLTPNLLSYINLLPALIESYKTQTRMISRLAIAMDKKELLEQKDIIFAIMLNSGAQSATNILIEKGGQLIMMNISEKLMNEILSKISNQFIHSALSSTFTGLVPGIGGAALGLFNRYMMKKIGLTTISILSKNIQISPTESVKLIEDQSISLTSKQVQDINCEKLKVLINLMRIDGDKNGKEFEHICLLIQKSNLTDAQRLNLYSSLSSPDLFSIHYETLKQMEQLEIFIFDLIAFTSYDTSISLQEIAYISRLLNKLELKPIDHYIMY